MIKAFITKKGNSFHLGQNNNQGGQFGTANQCPPRGKYDKRGGRESGITGGKK